MNQETADALKVVDHFHKDCALLFEDLVRCIYEKPFTKALATGQAGYYSVGANSAGVISSSHQRVLVIDKSVNDGPTNRFQFAQMLVKAHEDHLRGDKSPNFKAVCQRLGVDPVFPLLLVTGVLEPRDVSRSRFLDSKLGRQWVGHTLLLYVPQDIRLLSPDCYRFGEWLTIESKPGTDSWYCEKAKFKIRRLLEIHDSREVEKVVDELFGI